MKLPSLKTALRQLYTRQLLRRTVVSALAALLLIWIAFFDSHSLYKRITWNQEAARLAAENQVLKDQIEELDRQLGAELPDEVIERLARERYGMRKDGEIVYPLVETP